MFQNKFSLQILVSFTFLIIFSYKKLSSFKKIHSKHLLTYISMVQLLLRVPFTKKKKMVLLVCLKLTIKSKFQHSQSKYIMLQLICIYILYVRQAFPSVYLYIIQNSGVHWMKHFHGNHFYSWAVYLLENGGRNKSWL